MKSAGKARNNGLYRHIRTSKEIIRNLLNDFNEKKNGKVQNRTLPSSIEMSYKVKILRQTGVAPAHRGHIAILTLCNCY